MGTTRILVRLVRTRRYWTFESIENVQEHDADERKRHIGYVKMILFGTSPSRAASMDSSRVMIAMFCINSLASMDALDAISLEQRNAIVEWLYSRQSPRGGFSGGFDGTGSCALVGHLAMTYSALISLVTLGDDLKRVDKKTFSKWLSSLQETDGSFRSNELRSEADSRFVYSAVASCFLLQDWTGINITMATEFILSCQNSLDGGFGLSRNQESHGGATYTCLAALNLLGGVLDTGFESSRKQSAISFCAMKQDAGQGGFVGRTNKECDTCYAYWVGGALAVLGREDLIRRDDLARYLDMTSHPLMGGYGKTCGETSDPYHTHFGACARLLAEGDIHQRMDIALGLSRQAFDRRFKDSCQNALGNPYW